MTGASEGSSPGREEAPPPPSERRPPRAERPGWVVWITGLQGSGKTTVGRLLAARLREHRAGTVFLDGDELRAAFEHDLGYGRGDRLRAARRYVRLARLLSGQGLNVVVATVSLFSEIHEWNREHLPSYLEVYLHAPLAVRRARSRRALPAEDAPLGPDASYEEPAAPHLTIDDDGTLAPEAIAGRIWQRLMSVAPALARRDG